MYDLEHLPFIFRSNQDVSRIIRVRNVEVRRRAGIERELASRADQCNEMVWTRGEDG